MSKAKTKGDKRKTNEAGDGEPADKKMKLPPSMLLEETKGDTITLVYKGFKVPAKLEMLRMFCKHPRLARDNPAPLVPGMEWAIDEKLVYLGEDATQLKLFVEAVEHPRSVNIAKIDEKRFNCIMLGIAANFFEDRDLLARISDYYHFGQFPSNADFGLNCWVPWFKVATSLTSAPRDFNDPRFTLYCFCIYSIATGIKGGQTEVNHVPKSPPEMPGASQVIWDAGRVASTLRMLDYTTPPRCNMYFSEIYAALKEPAKKAAQDDELADYEDAPIEERIKRGE